MQINTKKVRDRRKVRFDSTEAVFADIESLAAAERAGSLTSLGNWSLGQAINHLAVWAEYSFSGAPVAPPWPLRVVARLFKKRILTSGFPAGVRFGKAEGGTLGAEPTPTHAAISRYRTAIDRFLRETPEKPNPLLGRLASDEWQTIHRRHAELHLSFFKAK